MTFNPLFYEFFRSDEKQNDNTNLTVKAKKQEEATKKQCESCQEMFLESVYESHFESCKVYFKHMTKTSAGYDCKGCIFKVLSKDNNARQRMYSHLKNKHRLGKLQNSRKKCETCKEMIDGKVGEKQHKLLRE